MSEQAGILLIEDEVQIRHFVSCLETGGTACWNAVRRRGAARLRNNYRSLCLIWDYGW
jgi:hypothetical protein